MDKTDPKVVQFPGVRMRGPDLPDPLKNFAEGKTITGEPVEVKVSVVKERPTLAAVDDLRTFVETGDCEGFIVIARQKSTGLFYTDIAYPGNAVPPKEAFAYMGGLDCIKNELADIACMAASVLPDGSLMDPGVRQ